MVRQAFQPLPGEGGKAGGQQDHEQENPSPELRFFALQVLRGTGAPNRVGRGLHHGEVTWFCGRTKPNTSDIVTILTVWDNRCCWRSWYLRGDFGRNCH